MSPTPRDWILDTSILVHVLRGDPLGRHLVEQQQLRARPDVPLVSVVSIGEIMSLGRQWNWGSRKLDYMREVLAELVVVDINSEPVLSKYAEIDAWCRQNGVKPGKNDLWIAATAAASDAMLLTADRDFDALDGVFITSRYFDPAASYSRTSEPGDGS